MPKSFIQEFLDVLALGFGTACTNCLQVEAIVAIKPFFWEGSACVFGHMGKIIQGLCHECGFILVEEEGNKRN